MYKQKRDNLADIHEQATLHETLKISICSTTEAMLTSPFMFFVIHSRCTLDLALVEGLRPLKMSNVR